MDDRTFDSLIQSLTAAGVLRRRTLMGFVAAALGLGLGALAPSDVDARKRRRKHNHKPKCKRKTKKKCEPRPAGCTPECDGRECGDDGCGKRCGDCAEGYDCFEDGEGGSACEVGTCTPVCSGQNCGGDGCGGTCACADPSACDNGDDQCCDPEGVPCAHFSTCCSGACDTLVGGGTCASCRGWYCDANFRCCDGLNCINNRCDGCYHRAIVCTSSEQCCFSECSAFDTGPGKVCLSRAGGRCEHDADCMSCYRDLNNCTNACVNGSCAF